MKSHRVMPGYTCRVTLGFLRATHGYTCHMRLHMVGYRAALLFKVTLGYTGIHVYMPSLLTGPLVR